MFVIGLNFVLALGRGKYAHIVKECVLSTTIFCAGIALSLLVLLRLVTALNGGLAALADAMVVSPELVIDLLESM